MSLPAFLPMSDLPPNLLIIKGNAYPVTSLRRKKFCILYFVKLSGYLLFEVGQEPRRVSKAFLSPRILIKRKACFVIYSLINYYNMSVPIYR